MLSAAAICNEDDNVDRLYDAAYHDLLMLIHRQDAGDKCFELLTIDMKVNIAENRIFELYIGDITEMETEAIVNAANKNLILGGGVAGAIRRKGGPAIQEECNKIGGTFVGGAVITGGGNLKAKYVIHTVGPRMGEGNEDEKLRNATLNSLKLADEKKITSISFPAISTGIFGFPIGRCAKIMIRTAIEYLKGQTQIKKIVFCLFDASSYNVFAKELKQDFKNESNGVKPVRTN